MKSIERLPPLSTDLVKALDEAFPPKCIGPNETLRDADRYAGKREVIEFLLRLDAEKDTQLLKV